MNRSRIGSKYENAYRALLSSRGFSVMRSAASKGPYDLVALGSVQCVHVQLTKRRLSCDAAYAWARAQSLQRSQTGCGFRYVHYTQQKEYCEHTVITLPDAYFEHEALQTRHDEEDCGV